MGSMLNKKSSLGSQVRKKSATVATMQDRFAAGGSSSGGASKGTGVFAGTSSTPTNFKTGGNAFTPEKGTHGITFGAGKSGFQSGTVVGKQGNFVPSGQQSTFGAAKAASPAPAAAATTKTAATPAPKANPLPRPSQSGTQSRSAPRKKAAPGRRRRSHTISGISGTGISLG